jgi:hypothetical protein
VSSKEFVKIDIELYQSMDIIEIKLKMHLRENIFVLSNVKKIYQKLILI